MPGFFKSLSWARHARWLTLPVAVVASGAIISTASFAAFSATTSNPTNNWSTGSVQLTDDDSNTALFTASGLMPGDTGTKCITVTSSGSLASTVRLHGTGATTTNSLSSYIDLTITQGTGGSNSSCSGFTASSNSSQVYSGSLANFASQRTNYDTGAATWSPTGSASEARTFQFTYGISQATPNTAQNSTAAIAFTWETRTR